MIRSNIRVTRRRCVCETWRRGQDGHALPSATACYDALQGGRSQSSCHFLAISRQHENAPSMPPTTVGETQDLAELVARIREQEAEIALGGGRKAIQRQHEKGRLTARERIDELVDPDTRFFEIGLWAGWEMYAEWGGAGRRRGLRHRHHCRPPAHDHRQRRHGEGRGLFSGHCQESAAGATRRFSESPAAGLSGRLGRRFSAAARRRFSRRRRLRPHLSQ